MGNSVNAHVSQPPASRDIRKADLIGMVVVSALSLVVITCISVRFLQQTRNKSVNPSLRWLALGHFIGDWVFCFFAAFLRTDLIFAIRYNQEPPHEDLPRVTSCKLAVYPQFVAYYASKACLYLLFIERIRATFAGSEYQCSRCLLGLFEVVVVLSETCLCALFVLFESFQFCSTPDDALHICSAYTEDVPHNIGGFAVELIAVLDLIFSALTLCIFVGKLRRLAFNTFSASAQYVALDGAEPSSSPKQVMVSFAEVNTTVGEPGSTTLTQDEPVQPFASVTVNPYQPGINP